MVILLFYPNRAELRLLLWHENKKVARHHSRSRHTTNDMSRCRYFIYRWSFNE